MFRYVYGLLLAAVILFLAVAGSITPATAHGVRHHHHGNVWRYSMHRPRATFDLVSFGERTLGARARNLGLRPTNWCADWVNLMLRRSGHRTSGSSMAMSFARYGRPSGAVRGAIAVMRGHVGIVAGTLPGGRLLILSGNYSRKVAYGPYHRSRIVAFRMPA